MLKLYKNTTPNHDGTYYLFDDFSDYESALQSGYVTSVTLNDYRINANVIKVAITTALSEADAQKLTYAIDERTNYTRCYLVKSVVLQSGYALLECEVDLWATYMLDASITNVRVTRCNRAIGVGLLDDIAATTGSATRTYCATTGTSDEGQEANALMARENVYIVFALKYNIAQNNAGSVSHIGLYAFKIYDLVEALYHANNDDPAYLIVNPVELAIDVVSGIYAILGTNQWGQLGELNAAVTGAWFTDNIAAIGANNMDIRTKPNWDNWQNVTLTPYEVIRSEIVKTLTIANDVDDEFYVGTKQNGLKLHRTTAANYSVDIRTIPSNDHLTILACQGDNQLDITDTFAVSVGTTDGDITAARMTLDVLQNSIKAVSGAILIGKGVGRNGFSTAMGITSFAGGIADQMDKARTTRLGNMVKGGDGALAYWRLVQGYGALNQPVRNAYVVNAYTSIDDEAANLRVHGAKFNVKVSSLHDLQASSLLGTGNASDPTYVEAAIEVDGVPTAAADHYKAVLQGGVYLKDLI